MLLSISTPWEKLAHLLNSVINGLKFWYPPNKKIIEALPRHDYFKKCQAQILLSFCLRVPLYSLPRKLSSAQLSCSGPLDNRAPCSYQCWLQNNPSFALNVLSRRAQISDNPIVCLIHKIGNCDQKGLEKSKSQVSKCKLWCLVFEETIHGRQC